MTKQQKFIKKIAETYKYSQDDAYEILTMFIFEAKELLTPKNSDSIDVLNYLNQMAERKLPPRAANLRNINARLSEGITVETLKQVIELKVFQWKADIEFRKYLSPDTLFSPSKIDKYIQEVEDIKSNPEQFKRYAERINKKREGEFDPFA